MGVIKFGTDGWRGIIAEDFTFSNVRLVCKAITNYLKKDGLEKKIVIGYDSRFLSENFAMTAAQVLTSEGITVYMPSRDMPTPVIASSVLDLKASGAIMFTASHNPSEYNGIKYIPWYGGPATDEIVKKIEYNLNKITEKENEISQELNKDLFIRFDPVPSYFKRLNQFFENLNMNAPVIYDPLHGTGRGVLDNFLKEKRIKVNIIHRKRDPLFGNLSPEPKFENLKKLIRLTRKFKCLGLSTDGDADRFSIVESGRLFSPNEILTLITYYLLEYKGMKGTIVRTTSTTSYLDKLALYYKVPLKNTPVGFKFIGEEIRKGGVLIGGEESGGISMGNHIPEKDGIFGCLLTMSMIISTGKSLNQLFTELKEKIPPVYNQRYDLHFDKKERAILEEKILTKNISNYFSEEIYQDEITSGRSIIFKDGSKLLMRISGTENVVRIYGEHNSLDQLSKLINEGIEFLKKEVKN